MGKEAQSCSVITVQVANQWEQTHPFLCASEIEEPLHGSATSVPTDVYVLINLYCYDAMA
uniref:Uncharacterized protein n=1 Tax=Pseudoalteromonas luteoviolacea TaxID=43657 RepID=A0A023PYN9_9GAMM|nr:hypothetical protein [Pseudoalteromonas luteoviolacea]